MLASATWLNKYLSPAGLESARLQQALIDAGFPIESATPLSDGDERLDIEITSNRGDCLSIVGLAREAAAKSGRALLVPAPPACRVDPAPASSIVRVENTTPAQCPRFTARVIRGVKVGPSPAWLVAALDAVGQRSINNVVDVTNFINFELGQPSHAFDLAKLAGGALVVRFARDGERLTTLDGKERTLRADELVVADAEKAQGLAGVMGGRDSEVTAGTTDVVLEVATWDPVTVRRASRRHQLRTDASHRYERLVDARTVDAAAARCAAMLAEVSGGRLCEGAVAAGASLAPAAVVHLRPDRCRSLLGMRIESAEIAHCLAALGVGVERGEAAMVCTIPAHRPDLVREVDLIEEVARVKGLEAISQSEKVSVTLRPAQGSEKARQEIASILAGMGFFEAMTFSFVSREEAGLFMPRGLAVVEVDDERRKEEPALRPSIIPGLLASRRANQNAQVKRDGGVRLFETAAVFAQDSSRGQGGPGGHIENYNLALLMDVPMKGKTETSAELQVGVRMLRGAIDAVVRAACGASARLEVRPGTPHCGAFEAGAYAGLLLNGAALGYMGVIGKATRAKYDLAQPAVAAELNLPMLLSHYPPAAVVAALPQFPGIERDISLIVGEDVTWDRVGGVVAARPRERLELWSFVGTFRGQQIGAGKKSMTVRLGFRDSARTLRHEEVDGVVAELVGEMKRGVGAEVRV